MDINTDCNLYQRLKQYSCEDIYPFHMPGHKRNPESGPFAEWYGMDVTEIEGFDNLYYPEDILLRSQGQAAELYGSEKTFFLVNGSTGGILTAISAVLADFRYPRGKLLIGRNSHKSVYHSAVLNDVSVEYIYPEMTEDMEFCGRIIPEDVRHKIDSVLAEAEAEARGGAAVPRNVISAIVITSPTYEGVCSDIKGIAAILHEYGIPLIVDQAHGAHFGLHPDFPESAVRQGADIVIHSLHKTLPAPTQTGLLHVNGSLVRSDIVRQYLEFYQTSSPSYLLMGGMDACISQIRREGKKRLSCLLNNINHFRKMIQGCSHISMVNSRYSCMEPGKLVLSVKGTDISGRELYDCLRLKYGIQMEMAAGSYVVGILTMMDTWEGFKRLGTAICKIEEQLETMEEDGSGFFDYREHPLVSVMKIREGLTAAWEEVPLKYGAGRIAADFISLYPPGIPIIVPGEMLNNEVAVYLENMRKAGLLIHGVTKGNIKVIKRDWMKGIY